MFVLANFIREKFCTGFSYNLFQATYLFPIGLVTSSNKAGLATAFGAGSTGKSDFQKKVLQLSKSI